MVRSAEWYFDFISPFSYLQFNAISRLPVDVTVRFFPVLFAGLLNHWGNKVPQRPQENVWKCTNIVNGALNETASLFERHLDILSILSKCFDLR
jgi:2-hydroxychromene-2-carboxylate isomerase